MKKLILTIYLLLMTGVYAEQKTYNFWWEKVPAVCSTTEEIERWAEDNDFTPINVSQGKEGGVQEGEVVYMVVYWLNERQETFASVQTPLRPDQSCVLFRTFDLKMNIELLKGTDL